MHTKKIHFFSLFFISSSLIALEISLMRVLRIEGFGNFTSTAIALAMTGFGAGGTAAYLLRDFIRGKEYIISLYTAVFMIFFLGMGYFLSEQISFDPLRILWDRNQLYRMFLRFFLYTVPFITGSSFIVIAFTVQRAGKVYFYNLTGSGFGVAAILAALYLLPPDRIFAIPLICASIGAIALGISIRPEAHHALLLFVLTITGFFLFFFSSLQMLPYKGLMLTLNFPDARIIKRDLSPFGSLEVVKSTLIRKAPGLSLAFAGLPPRQLGLFLDGDSISSIDLPDRKESEAYLHYQTQSAVYTLHEEPEAFLIGLGGGNGILRARLHDARSITVAEDNPRLAALVSDIQNTHPSWERVRLITKGARSVLTAPRVEYDIIEFSEPDSTVSSIGGIYSSETNYTLTAQAFEEYLAQLRETGTFSATVLLRFPPRTLLKLMALSKYAVETQNADPARCMIVIRSWATGTVLLKRKPFSEQEVESVKNFCREMFFDLVYYPGISVEETNRYNILKEELYYEGAKRILTQGNRYVKSYPFNIGKPTDDKPYFSFFFRIGSLPFLLRVMGGRWMLVVEGGELILFFTFLLTALLSFFLIIAPLIFSGIRPHQQKGNIRQKIQGKIFLYFGLIGISYMSIEIVLIGKYLRFLENPLYASSTIIAFLLFFSGIGSLLQDRLSPSFKNIYLCALLFIAFYIPLLLLGLSVLSRFLITAPLAWKLVISLLMLAPAGIAMGIPFPSAIERLRTAEQNSPSSNQPDDSSSRGLRAQSQHQTIRSKGVGSVPWAWSVNGYLSVVASTGAVLATTCLGLTVTGIIASFLYIAALFVFPE
jgi:hypothetical protein